MVSSVKTDPRWSDQEVLALHEGLVKWLQDYLESSGKKGYVLGVSGGVDSCVMAAVAREAVGRISGDLRVLIFKTQARGESQDTMIARELLGKLGLPFTEISLTQAIEPILNDSYISRVVAGANPHSSLLVNLRARLRYAVSYLVSNQENLLVLGTVNREEYMLGYFPKNAAAGDLLPFGHVPKSLIRALGRLHGLPAPLVEKKASGCAWADTAEEEWGFSEDTAECLVDLWLKRGETALMQSPAPETVKQHFVRLVHGSAHKRSFYPVFTHPLLES